MSPDGGSGQSVAGGGGGRWRNASQGGGTEARVEEKHGSVSATSKALPSGQVGQL